MKDYQVHLEFRTMPIGLGILAVMIFIPSPQLGLRSVERA